MAINLSSVSIPKHISIISVVDEAIDWENSDFESEYSENEKELSGVEAKKAHYLKSHDLNKIKFLDKAMPTFFVFKNPNRFEFGSKITDIIVQCSGMINKKEPTISDIHKRIWNLLFVGYYEGALSNLNSDNVTQLLQKPFLNGNITDDFLQVLFANDILEELSNAVQNLKKTMK